MNPEKSDKSTRKLAPAIVRYLMGIPLLVFGLNFFLHFIPDGKMPPGEDKAAAFSAALIATGYMMPLIGTTLTIVGVLLVLNRWVPLALAFFAPFIVNSLLFHSLIERTGLPMSVIFAAFEAYLAWSYRECFRPMLAARTSP